MKPMDIETASNANTSNQNTNGTMDNCLICLIGTQKRKVMILQYLKETKICKRNLGNRRR